MSVAVAVGFIALAGVAVGRHHADLSRPRPRDEEAPSGAGGGSVPQSELLRQEGQ